MSNLTIQMNFWVLLERKSYTYSKEYIVKRDFPCIPEGKNTWEHDWLHNTRRWERKLRNTDFDIFGLYKLYFRDIHCLKHIRVGSSEVVRYIVVNTNMKVFHPWRDTAHLDRKVMECKDLLDVLEEEFALQKYIKIIYMQHSSNKKILRFTTDWMICEIQKPIRDLPLTMRGSQPQNHQFPFF